MLIKAKGLNVYLFVGRDTEFDNLVIKFSKLNPTKQVTLVNPYCKRARFKEHQNVKTIKRIKALLGLSLREDFLFVDFTLTNTSLTDIIPNLPVRQGGTVVIKCWKNELFNILERTDFFEIRSKKYLNNLQIYK